MNSEKTINPVSFNKQRCGVYSIQFKDLGLITYQEAYQIQMKTVAEVATGAPNTVFFCEHPAVLTVGRTDTGKNFLVPESELQNRNVDLVRIDRGGEVTLHNPGQLVAYPIINLIEYGRDLRMYLHNLEQVAIDLLGDFDILARRIEGQRGVWAGDRKIASIGVGVKKWISYHGIAVNVCNDLNQFSLIRPCGLDVQMTSVQTLAGTPVSVPAVKDKFVDHWQRVFSA